MKKRLLLCSLIVLLWGTPMWAQGHKVGAWDPNSAPPFQIPEEFQELLKDYRKNWTRLTDIQFSGLHWNQGIVTYISKSHKVFINNYIHYLRQSEGLDDEDEECDEEEDDECESPFREYPAGTAVLKENYQLIDGVPQTPLTVTLMIKHPKGYDPEAGDWQYVQYDVSGNVIINGNSKNEAAKVSCASCHINIDMRDYVFSTFYHAQDPQKVPQSK